MNSDVPAFVTSLEVFVSTWPRLAMRDEAAAAMAVEEVSSLLASVDAAAMRDENAFWPTSLEVYGGYIAAD